MAELTPNARRALDQIFGFRQNPTQLAKGAYWGAYLKLKNHFQKQATNISTSQTKKPPRYRGGFSSNAKARRCRRAFVFSHRVEEISVFGRPGSDLLFQALRLSTIGAGEFNGRVRDGIGFRLPANTTRSAKNGNRPRTEPARSEDPAPSCERS